MSRYCLFPWFEWKTSSLLSKAGGDLWECSSGITHMPKSLLPFAVQQPTRIVEQYTNPSNCTLYPVWSQRMAGSGVLRSTDPGFLSLQVHFQGRTVSRERYQVFFFLIGGLTSNWT